MTDKLSDEEIRTSMKKLPGWRHEAGSIKKNFRTRNFPSTMGFVTAVCGFCQRRNHHPDYILMKFTEIEVSFSTHSSGGVTLKDVEIAGDIEKIPL